MSEAIREPAWLTAAADQRLAFMIEQTGGNFPEGILVTTPLTEPTDGDFEKWDHSCDNCGRVLDKTESMWTGTVQRKAPSGHQVLIQFGACEACKNL